MRQPNASDWQDRRPDRPVWKPSPSNRGLGRVWCGDWHWYAWWGASAAAPPTIRQLFIRGRWARWEKEERDEGEDKREDTGHGTQGRAEANERHKYAGAGAATERNDGEDQGEAAWGPLGVSGNEGDMV